jgi:hypothetical protein
LGHQVGVDVVVGNRAVFVGAGDAVDVDLTIMEMPEEAF